MKRLFLALPLSPEGARALWHAWEPLRFSRIRWVPAEQFHITLVFLGETEEREIPVIVESMEKTGASFSSFPVLTGGPGAFPGKKGPRVLFESFREGGDRIAEIQKDLSGRLSPFFTLEKRKFHPHITTARIRPGTGLPSGFIPHGGTSPVRDTLNRIVLFESVLSSRGAEYYPLHETPLNRS